MVHECRCFLANSVWDATVITMNRDCLLETEVAKDFLALAVEQARGQGWASEEHLTVGGSLLGAWASVMLTVFNARTRRVRAVFCWSVVAK
jgi:hypothetical protein